MARRELLRKAIRQRDGMDDALKGLLFMCASDVCVVPMLRGFARRLTELERTLLALAAGNGHRRTGATAAPRAEGRQAMRTDPHADVRGKWDIGGNWWCDCPAKNPDTRYICRRCDIRRPLRGSTIYQLRDRLQGAGFMRLPKLEPVAPSSGGEK